MKILTKKSVTKKLNSFIPKDIKNLSMLFQSNGFDLFLVGGCIRDTFLNMIPKDFDVCTNANPKQIQNILKQNNIDFNLQGEHFGVVVAKLSEDVEIATFRTEFTEMTGDNKDTTVQFGCTIEEDVQRRDLTINGLFFNMSTNTIVDLVDGVNDLKYGIVRTIGNPVERFKEDNLRKLRAIRFASRLDFIIEPKTIKAIEKDPSLNVSSERIVTELENAFNRTVSKKLLATLLVRTNLADVIFQNTFFVNAFSFFENHTFSEFIFEFVKDFTPTEIRTKLTDLKFTNQTVDTCVFLKELSFKLRLNETINPLWFFKTTKRLKIDTINVLEDKRVFWLEEFKPNKTLASSLMEQGFEGAELGKEIEKVHLQLFKDQFDA